MRKSISQPILIVCLFVISGPAWSSDFRDSDWGATVNDVKRTEQAELTQQEDAESGWHIVRYATELLGQTTEVAYFFGPSCKRLVAGHLSFARPLSESQFLMITLALSNIYGEGESSGQINGGSTTKWESDGSEIQFRHWPLKNEHPKLKHLAPSQISYRAIGDEPC